MKSINAHGIISLIIILIGCAFGEIVYIDDGAVEGTNMTSRLGRTFHAFLRIPFAQPPIGNLRFQAPIPIEPWNGTLDGTFYGPMCVQVPRIDNGIEISEDCLHVNVFTPNLEGSLPVIVYVFGGGFLYGTGIDQGRPHQFMDRDVVVVHFNYRLGALGFLDLGTKEIPGNAAMKDQVLALRWIQRNIQKFGGNPNSVTIVGLSAGAVSVTAHMLSPMARGLFHKVISMSGAISSQRSTGVQTGIDAGRRLAVSLNCTETNSVEGIVTCLRERAAIDIITAVLNNPMCGGYTWYPTVEENFGQERYLEDEPDQLLASGNFHKVPVLIGMAADEFVEKVPDMLSSPNVDRLNEDFHEIAPCIFNYEQNTTRSISFSNLLRKVLLPLQPIDLRSFDALKQLYTDTLTYRTHRFVHFITNYTDVYYYKFSYIGQLSLFYYPGNKPFGVTHADDLQYTFNAFRSGPTLILPGHPDEFMVDRMTRIYESFALTGDPNYNAMEMRWPKHNISHEYYMDIGSNMIEKHGLFLERYAIWDQYDTIGDDNESECSSTEIFRFEKILLILLAILLSINEHRHYIKVT